MNHNITSFLLALASTIFSIYQIVPSAEALPLQHLPQPQVQWNTNVGSPLLERNSVFLSPDDKWLYVTDKDGRLSKIDPANGGYKAAYVPEQFEEQSKIYCEEGIAFYDGVGEDDDPFLLYWIFEASANGPVTRVIAIKHDPEDEGLEVLWTKNLSGNIAGMPVIGSEGKFIYFTMNSPVGSVLATPPPTMSPVAPPVETDAPVSSPPTTSPVKAITGTPTVSPMTAGSLFDDESGNAEEPTSNSKLETVTKPAFFWAENTDDGLKCVNDNRYPDEWLTLNETVREDYLFDDIAACCVANLSACTRRLRNFLNGERHLQSEDGKSGKFIILSHHLNGTLIYEFDSTTKLDIQKHDFAPVGIAHRPAFGNYNGGEENTHDVIMWGSGEGSDARKGETMLFQLPKDFSDFSGVNPADTSGFQVRVMESVSWTTRTRPTFSDSGLDVYFAVTGNSITGWNRGRLFDVVANLGPVRLPPGTDGSDSGALRPIILANDDTTLLVGSTDNDILYYTEHVAGGIIWTLGNLGSTRFTTPRLSQDGDVAYFGKSNTLQAINLADEALLWGEDGYVHPSNSPSDAPTIADFSISSTGEYLYYCRSGSSISGLRIAELIPTAAPIAPTSTPSLMPSAAASLFPSLSVMPSTSLRPTSSSGPTVDPDYIPPSLTPTLTLLPSAMPSVDQTDDPSTTPTTTLTPSGPTLAPVVLPPTASPVAAEEEAPTLSPVAEQVTETAGPTSSPSVPPPSSNIPGGDSPPSFTPPTATPPTDDPPSAAAQLPDDTKESESSTSLSTAAIIGIAVGGGVGLILIIGLICYFLKKKNSEDDGVDRDWQASNQTGNGNAGGQEEGAAFQYGDEERNSQSNQRWGQSGELRW